jgi:hypothetical protein
MNAPPVSVGLVVSVGRRGWGGEECPCVGCRLGGALAMAGSTNTSDKSGLVRRQQRRRKGTLTFEKAGQGPSWFERWVRTENGGKKEPRASFEL